MNDPTPLANESQWASRLRQEAQRHSPEFSDPLHEKIMRKIHQDIPIGPAHHGWKLAMAASLLIVAGAGILIYQQMTRRPDPVAVQVASTSLTWPLNHGVIEKTGGSVNRYLAEVQYAHLDTDAQRFVNFLDQRVQEISRLGGKQNSVKSE